MKLKVPVAIGVMLLGSVACGPKTLQAKLLNSEKQATAAEASLDEADRQLAALEPDRAEAAISSADKALADPDVGYYPEREQIRQRLVAAQTRLPEVRVQRVARDLEVRLQERRALLEKALVIFQERLGPLGKKGFTSDALDEAKDATGRLKDAISDGSNLEKKDPAYSVYAGDLRHRVEQAGLELDNAKRVLEFIRGPGELRRTAVQSMMEAKAQTDASKRLSALAEAQAAYRRCADDGTKAIATAAPPFARTVVELEGAPVTPEAVVGGCKSQAVALDKRIATLTRAQALKPRPKAKQNPKLKKPRSNR